ncbi:MAG: type II toxin-antitoxin system HigB family toxin [Ardenticatenaceae bacterium]|nr:type II toxin-antitoxin system HigB family toxin [Ardenticatenaceae bacterium]
MRIIARKTLKDFWETYPDAEQPLRSWFAQVSEATWQTPADIKIDYRHASFLANNRVVFNIKGNNYRVVVAIKYEYSIVYIRFVGTHQAYDRIDAATI